MSETVEIKAAMGLLDDLKRKWLPSMPPGLSDGDQAVLGGFLESQSRKIRNGMAKEGSVWGDQTLKNIAIPYVIEFFKHFAGRHIASIQPTIDPEILETGVAYYQLTSDGADPAVWHKGDTESKPIPEIRLDVVVKEFALAERKTSNMVKSQWRYYAEKAAADITAALIDLIRANEEIACESYETFSLDEVMRLSNILFRRNHRAHASTIIVGTKDLKRMHVITPYGMDGVHPNLDTYPHYVGVWEGQMRVIHNPRLNDEIILVYNGRSILDCGVAVGMGVIFDPKPHNPEENVRVVGGDPYDVSSYWKAEVVQPQHILRAKRKVITDGK